LLGGATANKLRRAVWGEIRDKHLDEHIEAGKPSAIRRDKERFLRQIKEAQEGLSGLFGDEGRNDIQQQQQQMGDGKDLHSEARDVSLSALRIYKLLRPESKPFYREDSMLGLETKLNSLLMAQAPAAAPGTAQSEGDHNGALVPSAAGNSKAVDPLSFNLPVVNPNAFAIALEAATRSLAEDLHHICQVLGVDNLPTSDDPLRFRKTIDALFHSFRLRKDPSYVDEWMERCWHRLAPLLPKEIRERDTQEIAEWLRGHLTRVVKNQSMAHKEIHLHSKPRDGVEWYDFGEDFMYDDFPLPADMIDERNLKDAFPLDKAGEYFTSTAKLLQMGDENVSDLADQFQSLCNDLETIGLRNWLTMDIAELAEYLPSGDLPQIDASPRDRETARLLLKAAARGKANLLEFDALDPYKLLHRFEPTDVSAELSSLPENRHLSDEMIDQLFDIQGACRSLGRKGSSSSSIIADHSVDEAFRKRHGKTPMEVLVDHEMSHVKTAGPLEWVEQDGEIVKWTWRKPANALYDAKRDRYVREQEGIDPLLKIDELRQTQLHIARMGSMCSDGRLYYYRSIVCVGNGRGLVGFGVGFGESPKEARADAALKALQHMEFVDLDRARTLNTPVYGREYGSHFKIIGRPIGRGIRANRKFLPILYLIGLDNCRVTFPKHESKWFTRIRAIRRALDMIQSRRTMANATGKKYSLLVAPGSHWVHWPDRWFRPIFKEHKERIAKIKEERKRTFRKGFRSTVHPVLPSEVKPEVPYYAWKTPLYKYYKQTKLKRAKELASADLAKTSDVTTNSTGSAIALPVKLGGDRQQQQQQLTY